MIEDIAITGIGSDLQGVGRLADGRAVFVPGAIPGERVRAQIEQDKGRYCTASLCQVLEPSSERQTPPCPFFGACGGCQGQHMMYADTLAWKRQIVFDALQRLGGQREPAVLDTLGCADPFRTRNKAEYPVGRTVDGQFAIGAFAKGSRTVVPISDCLLQCTTSAEALRWFSAKLNALPFAAQLRYLVTRITRSGKAQCTLCGVAPIQSQLEPLAAQLMREVPQVKSVFFCILNRKYAHALDGRCVRLCGAETLRDELLGLSFDLSPQAFFQVNAPQAERLYLSALEGAGIAPGCSAHVLDAYCGAGTITLAAASRGARAVGIEIVPQAIENARKNASCNGLSDNARFICGDAAREIPALLERSEFFDAAILDPPRKGADPALLRAIGRARIPIVSYVSCNPATLARDIRLLCEFGYRLERVQPVDMFPWTSAIESSAILRLCSSPSLR